MLIGRDGHNFHGQLKSLFSVDSLVNGTMLIFHILNVNLTEELLFLNLIMAPALKVQLFVILYNLTL
jgi:hypothetical protein